MFVATPASCDPGAQLRVVLRHLLINVFMQRGELNDLQKKSSEDLWKEDLAVFITELDVSVSDQVNMTCVQFH